MSETVREKVSNRERKVDSQNGSKVEKNGDSGPDFGSGSIMEY